MSYSIIQYPAQINAYTPTRGRTVNTIVLHSTGGSKKGDLATLSGNDRKHLVSCHYYITRAGEVYQLVQDHDVAWHAGACLFNGERDLNSHSIGIELENDNKGTQLYPKVQMDRVIDLTATLIQKYTIPLSRLVRHADIAVPRGRRTDPVRPFAWGAFRAAVFERLPPRYVVRMNGTVVRTDRSRSSPPATFDGKNPVLLPEGMVIIGRDRAAGQSVSLLVNGEMVTTDQWVHWGDNGFIWAGLLEQIVS